MDSPAVLERSLALSALLLAVGALPAAAQWGGIRPLPADTFRSEPAQPQEAPAAPAIPQPRPLSPAPPRVNGPEQVTVSPAPEPTFAEDSVRSTQRVWRSIATSPPAAAGRACRRRPAAPSWRWAPAARRSRRCAAASPSPATCRPRAADGDTFDMALEEALRRFQLRHGLTTTGWVGPMTFKALNVPAEERVRQIEASLARLIEHDFVFTQRYVAVNLAAAAVEAIDGGQVVRRYPAVVGKPGNASPELVARITAVNLNPTWTAPLSIVKKEILPKLARDPGYLARANMRLIDDSGRELDPAMVNLSGPVNFSVRQDSGSANSLGFVRIDMPNDYSVYMHDTPRRELFQSDYRFHSHGCVRVGDVRALAAWLLEDVPGWSRGEIDAAIASGKRTDIRLARAVPVVWIYLTGWGTADGTAHFREDVYDLDDRRKLDPDHDGGDAPAAASPARPDLRCKARPSPSSSSRRAQAQRPPAGRHVNKNGPAVAGGALVWSGRARSGRALDLDLLRRGDVLGRLGQMDSQHALFELRLDLGRVGVEAELDRAVERAVAALDHLPVLALLVTLDLLLAADGEHATRDRHLDILLRHAGEFRRHVDGVRGLRTSTRGSRRVLRPLVMVPANGARRAKSSNTRSTSRNSEPKLSSAAAEQEGSMERVIRVLRRNPQAACAGRRSDAVATRVQDMGTEVRCCNRSVQI